MKLFISHKIIILSIWFWVCPAQAQTIIENEALSFGKFVLVDNNAPRTINLLPNGSYIADPKFIFFNDPQIGNISVEDYPPLTTLTIIVGTTSLIPNMTGTMNFFVESTFTNPAVVITDALGSATFDVGATLKSNGNGSTPTDDTYQGVYSVTVTP